MASNIREFSLALRKDAAEWAPGEVSRVHRAAHMEVARRTIMASPVDTARFKNNWQSGVRGAPAGEIERLDASGAAAISATADVVAGVKEPTVSYLVNNLPYSEALAEGHSPQAPPGWFDAIINGVSVWLGSQ
jgi:hypothetical protein